MLYFLLFALLITTSSFGQKAIILLEDFSNSDPQQYTVSMSEQFVSPTAYFSANVRQRNVIQKSSQQDKEIWSKD